MIDQTAQAIDRKSALLVVERLNSYIATGQSLDRLAYICSVDERQIQSIAAGEIIGRKDDDLVYWAKATLKRIAEYLDTLETIEDAAGHAETETFKRIYGLISHAHRNNSIVAITGAVGIGKSDAARYYAATHPRRYNQPGAVYVLLNETENSPRQVILKILHHLGIPVNTQSQRSLMQRLLSVFRPGDHLILDECQKIKEALEIVSSLHDEAGIGITLIGNPVFSSLVWGDSNTFAALASRANRFDFPANSIADVDAWLKWHGSPEDLDTNERLALAAAARKIGTNGQSNGGLRTLAHCFLLYETLYSEARLTGKHLEGMVSRTKNNLRNGKAGQ